MPPQTLEARAPRPRDEDRARDGWASKRNGELLALAASKFDVFLTADRNLSYQQDVSAYDIAVVVLTAHSNRLDDLRPLVPRILKIIPTAQRRYVTVVRATAVILRMVGAEDKSV